MDAGIKVPTKTKYNRELHNIFNEIQTGAEELGLNSLMSPIGSIRKFAQENTYLDVAVLGQFKVGKSSFLNGLLQQNILPTGDLPVTSVITRIHYGSSPKATVTFSGGSHRTIELSEVALYVSESENPKNQKNVILVDVETPAMVNMKKIRLVDTPGTGSIWRHNTETTAAWFPETGGAFILISAERPVSENELELLKEIFLYTPEIHLIMTKTDLYSEAKLREIESFTSAILQQELGRGFPIMHYSILQNTGVFNRTIMEKALLPMAASRDEVFVKILKHKTSSLAQSYISYLDIAYTASLKMESERQRLKDIILDEHLNSAFVRQELLLITQSYKEKTRESMRQYLDSYRVSIVTNLTERYDSASAHWEGNLFQVARQYETWMKNSLIMELKEILLNEEKSYELIAAVRKHFTFYLKSFRERLTANLERVLGAAIRSEQWEISQRAIAKPDVSISRSFDMHLDMLWFLFPMFMFRPLFLRYFKKQINMEVEKNLHRMISNY